MERARWETPLLKKAAQKNEHPDQFLVTGGLRYEVPAGSYEAFQGHGPVHLAPYLTAGKEFGLFHVLTENKVTLVSVRSVGQQTEQAFLDLVEKEESRGFTRLYHAEAA